METIQKTSPGEALKRLREAADLTQCELAEISGVNQADISKIENGVRTPGLVYARRLAKALNTSPINFLDFS